MIKLFIITTLLIIIFYLLNNYYLKPSIKENYLTYFLPFYSSKVNLLANFYNNDDNNKNYFKKKFDYRRLNFSFMKYDKAIIKTILTSYIANSNIMDINLISQSSFIKNIYDIQHNKNNFALIDYPMLNYYYNYLNKEINNIKLVIPIFKIYIYLFTKKEYKIFTLDEITPDTIIGILTETSMFYFYKIYFKCLGYNIETDIKTKTYDSYNDLFNGFLNNECQMILISETFPNDTISNFLDNNAGKDIILLPFNTIKEKIFIKKLQQIYVDYIDLNNLSSSYLPVKFNKTEYNTYRPDFKISSFYKILVSNVETDSKMVYDFINFYYKNIKSINTENQLLEIKIDDKLIFINYHPGMIQFFKDNGFITTIDNDNCKYLYGVMECNETNLKNNKLSNKLIDNQIV